MMRAQATNLGCWTSVETRLGTIHIATLGDAVVRTGLPGTPAREFLAGLQEAFPGTIFTEDDRDPTVALASRELQEYAAGARRSFTVRALARGTGFQMKVWHRLSNIPYGEVRTYADIAREVGSPQAFRAVGQANHNNPVAPFVPCHRVVASGGGLGGYGGGLQLKQRMLRMEGVDLDDDGK